jgi:hypothetical protein
MASFSTKAARILFPIEHMLQNPFNQHVQKMRKTIYIHAPFQYTHHQQPYDLRAEAAAAKSLAIISLPSMLNRTCEG